MISDNGDMSSFAATPDGPDAHLLNNKRWTRSRIGQSASLPH
ncbi:hypothetical protein [Sandarakinorhabdus sp.]